MKEKILAAIRAKFPAAKLTAKRLDALAATIEAKAGTDETLIDGILDALNELYPLADIAKDDHVRATLEGRLKATQTPKKDDETPAEKAAREAAEAKAAAENADADKDTPAWVKELREQNKAITQTLAAMLGDKQKSTIKTKANELLKDKVPEIFYEEWTLPEKEEDLPAFVEKATTKYNAFAQEQTNNGFSVIKPPKSGDGKQPSDVKKATPAEVEALVNDIM